METNHSIAELTPDIRLSHLILVDPKAAEMLASIGLDPAEHEEETLRAVCKQRQWSEVEVLQWIKKHRLADEPVSKDDSFEKPDLRKNIVRWCGFIEENTHSTILEVLNQVSKDFPRVMQIHGNQYPWLKNMKWHVEYFEDALRLYLTFEQKKFFPLIQKWQKTKGETLDGMIREVRRCATLIKRDQERLKNNMAILREKGNEFDSPNGACTTLRILNQKFKMLYSSLDKHFKVEQKTLLSLVQEKLDAS